MEPNLHDSDLVIIKVTDKLEYDDVVVFKYQDSYFIKRVIGVEGDQIIISDNTIYLNGEIKESDYYSEGYLDSITNPVSFDGEFHYYEEQKRIETNIIPSGYYFFLGDNREAGKSKDSITIGLIKEEDIVGKVIKIIHG